MLYLVPFLMACILSAGITGGLLFISRFINVLRHRREHGRAISTIPRIGGIAMIIAFLITIAWYPPLVFDRQWYVFLIAIIAVGIIGIIDDLWVLTWKSQLFAQISIVLFLFVLGIHIDFVTNPLGGVIHLDHSFFGWASFAVSTVWIIAIINAINWVDGVDGLGGGLALIGALAIFAVSLLPHVNQPPVAIVSVMVVGVTMGFLMYNWQSARVVAGTTGAFFWGLMIAVLAIFAGAKIATALLVMTIPLVDALWVIGERIHAGDSIFAPDKRHLHHKLLARGLSQRQIATAFIVVTSIIATSSVYLTTWGKAIVILGVIAGMIGILWRMRMLENM